MALNSVSSSSKAAVSALPLRSPNQSIRPAAYCLCAIQAMSWTRSADSIWCFLYSLDSGMLFRCFRTLSSWQGSGLSILICAGSIRIPYDAASSEVHARQLLRSRIVRLLLSVDNLSYMYLQLPFTLRVCSLPSFAQQHSKPKITAPWPRQIQRRLRVCFCRCQTASQEPANHRSPPDRPLERPGTRVRDRTQHTLPIDLWSSTWLDLDALHHLFRQERASGHRARDHCRRRYLQTPRRSVRRRASPRPCLWGRHGRCEQQWQWPRTSPYELA